MSWNIKEIIEATCTVQQWTFHKSVDGGQTFWTVEGCEDDGEFTP